MNPTITIFPPKENTQATNELNIRDAISENNSYADTTTFLKVSDTESEYVSIDKLLSHLRRRTGSEGTKRGYLKRIHAFCKYLNMNPDQVIALPKKAVEEFIQTYADSYNNGTYSPAYINNNILAPIRTLFRSNGFKGSNALDVEGYYVPPRYKKKYEYVPTKNEIYLMADNAGSLKGRAIILTEYSSGLRPSTLRALLYKDIKTELAKNCFNLMIPVYPEMKLIEPAACKNNIPYYTFTCDEATIAIQLYIRERIEKYGAIKEYEPLFASDYKLIPKINRKEKILCARQLQDIVKIPAKKVMPRNGPFVSPRAIRKAYESVLHEN
jgi:site-specific recombinase XerD